MIDVIDGVEPRFWNLYARVYDGLLRLTGYQELLRRVGAVADIAHGQTVLEVGCGTGNVLATLSAARPRQIIGIDASPSMLARAQKKLGGNARGDRDSSADLTLILGDAVGGMSRLPTGSVDRLIAVNFLYVLSDRTAFWREAARVLAPGGTVVAAHTDRPGSGPLVREQYATVGWRGLISPRLCAVAMFDAVIDALAGGGRFHFCGFGDLAAEASSAGLTSAEYLGRCYGGAQDGVNILARFTMPERSLTE